MNDTKWEEIHESFLNVELYDGVKIMWMTKSVDGYICEWDCTWTHFKTDPPLWKDTEWLKIKLTPENRKLVIGILKKIHVPGEVTETEAIIYGYRQDVDYI